MELSYHLIKYYGGLVSYYFGKITLAEDANGTEYISSSCDVLVLWSTILLCAVIAYILGSISFSIIISKKNYNQDIRNFGSGNAGMTNMLRTYGKKDAALTFAGDFLKTVVAVMIATLAAGQTAGYIAGLACMIGHAYPVFFRFKGGKGVACEAALILCTEPVLFVILFTIFAIIVISTKYMSLGSIMTSLLYPLTLYSLYAVIHPDLATVSVGTPFLVSFAIAVFVVYLHRSNIKKLLNGNENKISLKKHEVKTNSAENK